MVHRVILVPYDPRWPSKFEKEAAAVAEIFAGENVVIEHIGSTSVPGLGAKPVVRT